MLAPYTSAPPRHLPPVNGQPEDPNPANIPGAILPYPTEEVMRRGRLAFDEVGAIGETTEMTGGSCCLDLPYSGRIAEPMLYARCTVVLPSASHLQPNRRLRRTHRRRHRRDQYQQRRQQQEGRLQLPLCSQRTKRTLHSIWT